ncbi:hypothetical protein LTR70_006365 [Exophiala xenobiotica]|uniref:Heterokaryon incompatibility domain-containing protein n=1 Tax=Lithohypha guttulata TaxID=1690604 RepID=A0ABR0K7V0_9EURO|nr:hypothetical protein LTR24_005834 [Lithohypha guttulata]KAK5316310.1 hypothetical protein LTR70_006365 [Exophiala xenobiotica]
MDFHHHPLKLNRPSLRLIRILPLEPDGTVICEVLTSELPTNYVALSYCWGSEDELKTIMLVHSTSNRTGLLKVRKNLHDFLKTAAGLCIKLPHPDFEPVPPESQSAHLPGLMAPGKPQPWFWVDAICIDQLNIAERNHQVRQMGSIYRQADRVLVWLGNDRLMSKLLVTTSEDFHLKEHHFQEASQASLAGVLDLIQSNPYWERLWVIQEVILAKNYRLFVLCGNVLLRWEHLRFFTATLNRLNGKQEVDAAWVTNQKFQSLLQLRDAYHEDEGRLTKTQRKFIHWLNNFWNSECSDRRDMIYGLLSLVEKGDQFEVDYGLSTEALFLRVTTFFALPSFSGGQSMASTLLKSLRLDQRALLTATAKRPCSLAHFDLLTIDLATPGEYSLEYMESREPGYANKYRGWVICLKCKNMLVGITLEQWGPFYAVWCTTLGTESSYHFVFSRLQNELSSISSAARAVGLIYVPSCFDETQDPLPASLIDLHPDINLYARLPSGQSTASIKLCRCLIFEIMMTPIFGEQPQSFSDLSPSDETICAPFKDGFSVLEHLGKNVEALTSYMKQQDNTATTKEKHDMLQSFRTTAYDEVKARIEEPAAMTYGWALHHPKYLSCIQRRHNDVLWISADPGCNKTVVSKLIVDKELSASATRTTCHYFFNDNIGHDALTPALCAILHQLFEQRPPLLKHGESAFVRKKKWLQPGSSQLWTMFMSAVADLPEQHEVICVLDALDEARDACRKDLTTKLCGFYDLQMRAEGTVAQHLVVALGQGVVFCIAKDRLDLIIIGDLQSNGVIDSFFANR